MSWARNPRLRHAERVNEVSMALRLRPPANRVSRRAIGYWTASASYRKGTRYRVQWRDPSGQTFTGPPTSIYKF